MNLTQPKRKVIGNAVVRAFTSTIFLAGGYLVGYLHATDMPANAEPGFMLGFVVSAAIAAPTIYVLSHGLPKWLPYLDD